MTEPFADPRQTGRSKPRLSLWLLIIPAGLIMLACAGIGGGAIPRDQVIMSNRLPTLTPTPGPNAAALPAAPTPEVTPTLVDIPAANLTSETPGWTLAGGRIYSNQTDNNLLLYGDMINETGAVQEITRVTANLLDAQGQVVTGPEEIFSYLPTQIVPAGSRIPFELTVPDMQNISSASLKIEAQPGSQTPRQDFEFANLQETNEAGSYCLAGAYTSQGGELQTYLVIALVLYNDQDKIINFADYYADSSYMTSGQSGEFEVCVETLNQNVARYELRGWGE